MEGEEGGLEEENDRSLFLVSSSYGGVFFSRQRVRLRSSSTMKTIG